MIRSIEWNGMHAVEFSKGDYTALLIPGVGANLVRWANVRRGLEILRTPKPEEVENFKTRPHVYGLPLLLPPNRIAGARFEFEGREYRFPVTIPTEGAYHHGVIKSQPFMVSKAIETDDEVLIEARFYSNAANDVIFRDFPHEFKCKIVYRLTAEGLEQEDESSEGGRRMRMLQYIMLLKQICNHPAQAGLLAKSGSDYAAERSGKFKCIGDLCAEIASRQEKVLVFTQFREIIDPLSDYLAGIFGRSGLVLHGNVAVKKRGELVREFQSEDGPPFFILSLKAGGTGLNLTHASHVIHFDRWWNPAVEDQATDRAFRIGQKNNVLVHKCITRGTIEEHIDEMIQEKRTLADSALGNMENSITSLSDTEFLNLVRLDLKRALED